MGMYDNIDFEVTCPKCGELIKNFQSKDGPCCMYIFKFWEVDNFYSSCSNCGTWVEYSLKERKKRKITEYEKLVRISNDKHKCKNCKKLCFGTVCRECFMKNTRKGQLSRMRSVK